MSEISEAPVKNGEQEPLRADVYRKLREFRRIGSRAVREAQAESRRQGVPNVYSIGGAVLYEQPDGSLAATDPFDKQGRGHAES